MKPDIYTCSSVRTLALLMGLLVLRASNASAEIIYDNSGSETNSYHSTWEFGDEITLGGTNRLMTEFQFEYTADFVATGKEMGRVRLYKNDGPLLPPTNPGDVAVPTPGTVLFDSQTFPISPGNVQTKIFSGLSIVVPDDLTWTVQFTGLTGITGDDAGLIISSPPSVGGYFDDFWMKPNGAWGLYSWGGNPVANFAAQIVAADLTTPPQPTVSIKRTANNVVLTWSGTSVLQVATNPAGPYNDLATAPNTFTFDTHSGPAYQFWRLKN